MYTGHSTPNKPPLFKRGKNVVVEVILLHFRVRPFCVVASSSLWNWRSWVQILEPKLTGHSALHYHRHRWASQLPKLNGIPEVLDTFNSLQEVYDVNEGTLYLSALCLLGSVEFNHSKFITPHHSHEKRKVSSHHGLMKSHPCTHVQTLSLFSVIHYHHISDICRLLKRSFVFIFTR